jgi:WS/DGAT/MGAT family acyltransferase
MFYLTEKLDDPKHIGSVMVFERPKRGGDAIVRDLVKAYRSGAPIAPFDRVPAFPGARPPEWRTVDRFDMEYHVQPGNDEQLYRLVEDLHAPMLDRVRPGWKVYFIEGLAGHRFAVYSKVHHALVDGVSGLARVVAALDLSPRARAIRPFYSVKVKSPPRKSPPGWVKSVERIPGQVLGKALALGEGAMELARKALRQTLLSDELGNRPFTAPHTPMNEPIRTPRSIARVSLPLEEMRHVAHAWDTKLNDVAVCVIDAALLRYLEDIGRPAGRPLVHLCPVSVHDAGGVEATTQATALWVPGASAQASMRERMAHTVAAIRSAKDELNAMPSRDAAFAFGVATYVLWETVALLHAESLTHPLANVVLSNLHGPAEARYVRGARLVEMVPVSTLAAGIGLNITCISYAGTMQFGFLGNGIALPGLDRLAQHTRNAFNQLARVKRPQKTEGR